MFEYSDKVQRLRARLDEFMRAEIYPAEPIYAAQLEMNPIDAADRVPDMKEKAGIGYCNITKCCTKVCPEHIHITDNAIIPLKERVVDEFYDPLRKVLNVFRKKPQP